MIPIFIVLLHSISTLTSFAQGERNIEGIDFNIKISLSKPSTYQGTSTGENMIETKGYTVKDMMSLLMQPKIVLCKGIIDTKKYDILVTSKRNISEINEKVLTTLCNDFKLKLKISEIDVEAYELLYLDIRKNLSQSKYVSLPDGVSFQKRNNILLVGSSTLSNLADILSKESGKIYKYLGYVEEKYNFYIEINNIEKSLENCGIGIKKVKRKEKIYNVI